MPAAPALATLERRIGTRNGVGLLLKQQLTRVTADFDYILIDCPPVLGMLMINAVVACDLVVIPVQTDFLALQGLENMLTLLTMVTRSTGHEVRRCVVPTLYDGRTNACIHALGSLQHRCAGFLWDGVIPADTRFRDASRLGMPVSACFPEARGAIAYGELLESLLGAAPVVEHGRSGRARTQARGMAV
jgi:chromosome partitioning protein